MQIIKPFKFFSIFELCETESGLKNIPNQAEIYALSLLINNVLDPLRLSYGRSIKVNSGFRCVEVNKHVGGVSSSQHLKGEAADITGGSKEENKKIFEIIKKLGVYDQLIVEKDYTWIHVSYSAVHNRKMIINIK